MFFKNFSDIKNTRFSTSPKAKVFFILALFISGFSLYLGPKTAEAAFSAITSRGSSTENASDTSIAVSPSANLTVGKVIFVSVTTDNTATADGQSNNHTSVTDTDGNVWTKVFEYTDSAGAADDGSTTSLWYTKVRTQIDTTDSITANLSNARTDKIISIVETTVGTNMTVAVSTTTPASSDSNTTLSQTRSALTSREYLWFGLFGAEGEDTAKTAIANYVERFDLTSSTSGLADVNVQQHIGTRILTATGDTWTSSAVTFTNGIQTLSAFYEVPQTVVGDGTDPGNSTIAPGASVTDLGAFTLQTGSGSDTVTALTVTLGVANSFNNIAKVEITDGSNVDECTDIDDPSSVTLNFTGCSLAVTSSATAFKIRVTPKTHANMPAVPGASYDVTATVTSITATNPTNGSDTDSATITIDNASPAGVTSSTATPGDTVVDLAWTNPGDADFDEIVVLRHTSAISDVPVEGTEYSVGNTIGSATVACNTTTTSCQDTSLSNETAYHYKIFAQDSRGNYDAGTVPTGSPATPGANNIIISGTCVQSDGSTSCVDNGTNSIKVAVNGVLSGQSDATVDGSWSISGVAQPNSGDVVTVFVDGAAAATSSAAVTKYDGTGDITGMVLREAYLTLGSADNPTLTNTELGEYDSDDDSNIPFSSNSGVLTTTSSLSILSGTTLADSGSVTTTINGGSVIGDGTLTFTGGDFVLDGTGSFGGNTNWSFRDLVFGDGSGSQTTTGTGAGTITASSTSISTNQVFNAGSKTLNITGSSYTQTDTDTVAFVDAGNGTAGVTNTVSLNNLDISGTNRVVYVHVGIRGLDSSPVVSSVTVGGASAEFATSTTENSTMRSELWRIIAPSSGTGVTVTANLSANAASSIFLGAISLSGVDQTDPDEVMAGQSGTFNTSVSTDITTLSDNNLLVDFVHHRNDVDITEGAGQTNRLEHTNGATVQAISTKAKASAGSDSMSWTNGANHSWNHTVISVKPSTASASTDPFVISGTFTPSSGTIQYSGTNTVQVATSTYNNLILGGTGTYSLPYEGVVLKGNITVANGASVVKSAGGELVFSGGTTQTATDSNATKQDLGDVRVSNDGGYNVGDGVWCDIGTSCTTSWLARKKITIDNSASSENLTNFPILISLTSNNIDYSKTQASGQDIRFVDSDGTTLLSYEIERWDEAATSTVWVKVPQIDANSTTDYIWMYYDNSGYTSPLVSVTDDFNRASLGTDWEASGLATIISNRFTCSDFEYCQIEWQADSFTSNIYAQANISVTDSGTSYINTAGPLSAFGLDCHSATCNFHGGLYTGNWDDVYNAAVFGYTANDLIRLEKVGNHFLAYKNGDLVYTYEENTITTSGSFVPVLGSYSEGVMDNFSAGDIATSSNDVWDSNFVGVWHMSDSGGNAVFESTSNPNVGMKKATSEPAYSTDGKIGGAHSFDGFDDSITVLDHDSLDLTTSATISGWINVASWPHNYGSPIVNKEGNYALRSGPNSATDFDLIWWNGSDLRLSRATPPSTGTWHHVVGVVSSNDVYEVYVDGVAVGGAPAFWFSEARNLTNELTIGIDSGTGGVDGALDEVRISSSVRSAEWIEAEYLFGNSDENLTFGTEDVYSSAGPSTLSLGSGVKFSSLVIDSSNTMSANGSNTLTLSGDFTNNGSFASGTGKVVFEGAGDSIVSGSGSISFYNFDSVTAGKTIKFQAGKTVDFAGTITLTGSDGNLINIESTIPGRQWIVNFSTGQSLITYANINDSGCTPLSALVNLGTGMTSDGNSGTCWFQTPVENVRLQYGSGSVASFSGGGDQATGGGSGGGGGDTENSQTCAGAGVVACDNFNRANGALGSNWETIVGSPVITSNTAGASGGWSGAVWIGDDFPNNQYSEGKVTSLAGEIEVIVRATGDNEKYYLECTDSTCNLGKTTGASSASMVSSIFTVQVNDIIKLEVYGSNTLRYYKNGALVGTHSDGGTPHSSGRAGYVSNGGTIDDWSAGQAQEIGGGSGGGGGATP